MGEGRPGWGGGKVEGDVGTWLVDLRGRDRITAGEREWGK